MRNNKFFITAFAVVMIIILPFMCAKAQEPSGGVSIYRDPAKWGVLKVNNPNRDTIRVVMLVCDTASHSWVDSGIVKGKLVQIGEKYTLRRDLYAYWAYGYSVREFKGNRIIEINNGWTGQYVEPYYEHLLYLDDRKKPLINKIVWMAKEVGK